ncbi:Ldh family oxidoreductase [Acidisoma cellulosilytica]|uniref:Ldh family oxidoreductase n=1 Tax=Acidisoma cellulosilyticum TaxID=2802395 RepID=A0A963Z508_9PROT|nr:Ldh family oxidoreductase [Acidisoma cellulosilyticum]MCB8881903.1 Ldh family oxidoreductase [Acidisoma cellulosilyticum]
MKAPIIVPAAKLAERVQQKLTEAGADAPSSAATVRALMHGSLHGVDSHGVRLVGYYDGPLRSGEINGRPQVRLRKTAAATAMLDGDNGLGHHTGYEAMKAAVELARDSGIGAVGATGSSHYGAAGAYALAAAEAGMIGFATTNAESLVTLFGGREAFHGTNPLAVAAPVPGEKPWLMDMATSAIPFNRVLLYRSLGHPLPEAIAVDASGNPVRDPADATMLMPMGGADYGFKGAALAGVATLFSAILTGATLDHDLVSLGKSETAKPSNLGHFFIAIDPARFAGVTEMAAGMRRYLDALRASPPREGFPPPMAPGDREWQVVEQRLRDGIPVDQDTAQILGF